MIGHQTYPLKTFIPTKGYFLLAKIKILVYRVCPLGKSDIFRFLKYNVPVHKLLIVVNWYHTCLLLYLNWKPSYTKKNVHLWHGQYLTMKFAGFSSYRPGGQWPICAVNGKLLSPPFNYRFINWKQLSPCLKLFKIITICFLNLWNYAFFYHIKKNIRKLPIFTFKTQEKTMWLKVLNQTEFNR